MLKARLEQTEAALERIVAHMGSVTARLAQGGQGGKDGGWGLGVRLQIEW